MADEQRLYDLGFKALRPREFVSLLLAGEWRDGARGDRLIEQGKTVERIAIPISGSVEVTRNGQRVGALEPGQAIGLGLAVNDDAAPFDAAFAEPGRYMSWPLATSRTTISRPSWSA